MLGFPAEDRYSGPGVFSHIVKLSHPLRQPGWEGEVIQFEDLTTPGGKAGGGPEEIEDEYIMRPMYRKGCEIVVYRDANHLHSSPDYAYRESLWRFMRQRLAGFHRCGALHALPRCGTTGKSRSIIKCERIVPKCKISRNVERERTIAIIKLRKKHCSNSTAPGKQSLM
mmetsp:Transcript_19066/g.53124  ORF Transcript_19066/g.53124 Transcript_19066/m.53124 type:complete len:169 (-) Transcript_19066:18-524(-)